MQAMAKTNVNTFMFEKDKIEDITAVLNNSGIILYPTDTIWGIGCDATNPESIKKVYDLKQRDFNKPFIILVDSISMVKQYVRQVHPRLETLLHFHQRPLTVIYDQAVNLPDNLVSADGSIAIRIVQDEFCQQLIREYGRPLVSTSANISNDPAPGNFGEISSDVIKGVDYVGRQRRYEKQLGEPSVIVKIDKEGEMIFIRE